MVDSLCSLSVVRHPLMTSQVIEYDDIRNETDQVEYEEYEIYDDGYGFAERESAGTWDGEVLSATHPCLSKNPTH